MNRVMFVTILFFALSAGGVLIKSGGAYAAGTSEIEVLIQKGDSLFESNDLSEARRVYLKVIGMNSKNIRARNNLGAVYMALGEYAKAFEQFEEILKLDPDYSNAYENLGIIMCRKGDYDRAVITLKQALLLNSSSPTAYYNLGLAYSGLKNFQDGIKALKIAVKLNPSFSEALSTLGELHYRLDNLKEAQECLKKAVSVKPSNYTAYNTLGLLSLRQANYDEASQNFNKALKGPRNVQVIALYNMGLVYLARNDASKSIEYFKKTVELEPGFAAAFNDWAMILILKGNFEEAEKILIKAISIEPKNLTFNINLIDCYKKLSKYQDAISLCEYLIKLDAKNAQAYDELGHIYYLTGDGKKAKEYYEKAIHANPAYAEAHYHLGVLYDKTGVTDRALTEYKAAIMLNPSHVYAYNNIGFALMNGLKLDEAAGYLEKAVEINPGFTFALYNLGIVYFNRNKGDDLSKSKKIFTKILEIEPKESNFYKLATDALVQVESKK